MVQSLTIIIFGLKTMGALNSFTNPLNNTMKPTRPITQAQHYDNNIISEIFSGKLVRSIISIVQSLQIH